MRKSKNAPAFWAMLLAAAGGVQRLIIFSVYEPISFGDTPSYLRLAGVLSEWSLNGYDGTRVPGFPAFLAITGRDPQTAWISQLILGWIISLLWFWIAWRSTGSPALGFAVGACYNLLPGLFFFESNLLTETLTTFWVSLAVGLYLATEKCTSPGFGTVIALLCGVAASMAGMVRPLFFTLPAWLLPFIWFQFEADWKRRLVRVGFFSLGPLIILGGWLVFIHQKYEMLSPTTMGGYSLVQHTGEYFEDLPDEYADIRDTYIEFRDRQIAARGTQTNAIWDAIPAISQASGLGFYDLSRELQRLSIFLIARNPGKYLLNAAQGWVDFWKAPVYWDPAALRSGLLQAILPGMVVFGRALTLLANGLFLLLSGAVILSRRVRSLLKIDSMILLTGGYVWLTSILQTLLDHGDNPRFLLPLQMFVAYIVLRMAWSICTIRRERWSLKSAEV